VPVLKSRRCVDRLTRHQNNDLTAAPSRLVKPPRVKESPAAFECKHWKTIDLPHPEGGKSTYSVVFGLVVGIYIDESFIKDGIVDTGAMRPIARLGYMDYAVVTPETIFSINTFSFGSGINRARSVREGRGSVKVSRNAGAS